MLRNYNDYFTEAIARLHGERRYRVFADLERITGRFPHAIWHSPDGSKQVVIWCSNDYLGMGQHPKLIGAMVETATRMGHRCRRHPEHRRAREGARGHWISVALQIGKIEVRERNASGLPCV